MTTSVYERVKSESTCCGIRIINYGPQERAFGIIKLFFGTEMNNTQNVATPSFIATRGSQQVLNSVYMEYVNLEPNSRTIDIAIIYRQLQSTLNSPTDYNIR